MEGYLAWSGALQGGLVGGRVGGGAATRVQYQAARFLALHPHNPATHLKVRSPILMKSRRGHVCSLHCTRSGHDLQRGDRSGRLVNEWWHGSFPTPPKHAPSHTRALTWCRGWAGACLASPAAPARCCLLSPPCWWLFSHSNPSVMARQKGPTKHGLGFRLHAKQHRWQPTLDTPHRPALAATAAASTNPPEL
mgnify:CR=1 FL=1